MTALHQHQRRRLQTKSRHRCWFVFGCSVGGSMHGRQLCLNRGFTWHQRCWLTWRGTQRGHHCLAWLCNPAVRMEHQRQPADIISIAASLWPQVWFIRNISNHKCQWLDLPFVAAVVSIKKRYMSMTREISLGRR